MSLANFGDAANVISTFFAAIAAGMSCYNIFLAKKMAAEARANDLIKRSFELAIENPKLSTDSEKRNEQLYEWYCEFTLMMCDEVLKAYPGDERYRKFVRQRLEYISDDLVHWKKSDLPLFGRELSDLVRDVVDGTKP